MRLKQKPAKESNKALPIEDSEFRKKFISRLMNHRCTAEELSEKYRVPKKEIIACIDALRKDGVRIIATESRQDGGVRYSINIMPDAHNVFLISEQDSKERKMDFGFISDLHFASVFHLPKSFYEAMRRLADRGVKRVYVAGDVHDGTRIYKGHEVNLLGWTVEQQTDIAAEALFKHPDLEFWAIAGNHDYSFTKQNGVKPLAILEKKVDNFKNLGDMMADVVYHGIKIRLLHGGSGRVYATSYPSQTYLRDYFRGLEKTELKDVPHLLLVGHYHTYYQGKDHGIIVLQPGSFQDGDNEYCLRRGLTGPVGAFHITLRYKDGTINEFYTTYIQPKAANKERGAAFAKTTVSYCPKSFA
ncbi:MAG: metallophosphoesterase family protein [Candidatus Micrarchaeota archaeon]|nr:metallophosphoesterase family protein [Candidatus Micrarchaeota archaeon]